MTDPTDPTDKPNFAETPYGVLCIAVANARVAERAMLEAATRRGFAIAMEHAEPDMVDGDLTIDWTAARAALDEALR